LFEKSNENLFVLKGNFEKKKFNKRTIGAINNKSPWKCTKMKQRTGQKARTYRGIKLLKMALLNLMIGFISVGKNGQHFNISLCCDVINGTFLDSKRFFFDLLSLFFNE